MSYYEIVRHQFSSIVTEALTIHKSQGDIVVHIDAM